MPSSYSGEPVTGEYWRGLPRPLQTTSVISLRLIAMFIAWRKSGVSNSLASTLSGMLLFGK